jgi:hypothetical protein
MRKPALWSTKDRKFLLPRTQNVTFGRGGRGGWHSSLLLRKVVDTALVGNLAEGTFFSPNGGELYTILCSYEGENLLGEQW